MGEGLQHRLAGGGDDRRHGRAAGQAALYDRPRPRRRAARFFQAAIRPGADVGADLRPDPAAAAVRGGDLPCAGATSRRDLPPILTLSILGTVLAMAARAGHAVPARLAGAFRPRVRRPDFRDRPGGDHRHVQGQRPQGPPLPAGRKREPVQRRRGRRAVRHGRDLGASRATMRPTGSETAATLLRMVGGGVGVGALAGVATMVFARRTSEHLIELTWSTIAAFGSFLAAEHLHVSGVLATVTAGLVMGNVGLFRQGEQHYPHAQGPGNPGRLLGIRGLSRQFRGLPADRRQCRDHALPDLWRRLAGAVVVVLLGRRAAVAAESPVPSAARRSRRASNMCCGGAGCAARWPGARPVPAGGAAAAR